MRKLPSYSETCLLDGMFFLLSPFADSFVAGLLTVSSETDSTLLGIPVVEATLGALPFVRMTRIQKMSIMNIQMKTSPAKLTPEVSSGSSDSKTASFRRRLFPKRE